jgi:tetratricopeptide (TPR) repeat protein
LNYGELSRFRNAVLAVALALVPFLWGLPAGALADGAATAAASTAAPAGADAWVARGQQLYASGKFDEAIAAYSSAATANRGDTAAWSGLGNAFYAKGDYPNALKYYRFALQLNPSDAQLAAFVQRLTNSTVQTPSPGDLAMAKAKGFYASGQFDQALAQYKAAIADNPNNAKAYQGMGNTYYAMRDKDDAVSAYRRSLEIDPSNTPLKAFLARYSPEAARAAGVQVATGPADWTQPAWRSALLPGWGQVYNGDDTKGYVIGGLTLGALIGTIVTYAIGDAARTSYNTMGAGNSQSSFDTAYDTWNSMANYNNALALSTLAFYTFNIADAIMEAKPVTQAVGMAPGGEAALQMGFLDQGTLGVKLRLCEF